MSDYNFDQEDFSFGKELMEHNMSEGIARIVGMISEQIERAKACNAADDIIAIYNNEYSTYKEYIKAKERLVKAIEETKELKKEGMFFEGKPCNLSFTTYVDPMILKEEVYDYIMDNYVNKKIKVR